MSSTPSSDSSTDLRFIKGPFGCQIPRFPPHDLYVYELHFSQRYYHAGHYIGFSTNVEARLLLHRRGQGAKLTRAAVKAGIALELVRLWKVGSCAEGHTLERHLKKRHDGAHWCPICQHQPFDPLVLLRQGKRAWSVLDRPGKRQPMSTSTPPLFRRGQ